MTTPRAHVTVYAVIDGWRYFHVDAAGEVEHCPEVFHSDLEASGAAYMKYHSEHIPIEIKR